MRPSLLSQHGRAAGLSRGGGRTERCKDNWNLSSKCYRRPRCYNNAAQPPAWRPSTILDEWVAKPARPISLRQLTVFGRSLTEARLLSSANYVRNELPIRIAHRIRDMQTLPYAVVTNPNMGHVYELYYKAFESLHRVQEIRNLEDNDRLCKRIGGNLEEHLTVIPKLTMGVLECRDLMSKDEMDTFMNRMLRSRISRRVIAEQHIALTKTFHSAAASTDLPASDPSSAAADHDGSFVGEVFLKCCVADIIRRVGDEICNLATAQFGVATILPVIRLLGHISATFPYIPSHLEYIISELLRNSVHAVVEKHQLSLSRSSSTVHSEPPSTATSAPPPIDITICESPQHITIRISDQGGGIPADILPSLWAFSKGPRSERRLNNMKHVPRLVGSMRELRGPDTSPSFPSTIPSPSSFSSSPSTPDTSRPANLRLGMGLPLSRVYAEYWAGKLEVHSLAGYGTDAFLQISRLGNKNEVLGRRASMDGV